MVNIDHPDRSKPHQERSARDRLAWLEQVEVNNHGTFGDLHFLDPKAPFSKLVMSAAERNPRAFALSHNATGKGTVRDRRYVVEEITEVRSVDLVADGGTNVSLFESRYGGSDIMPTDTDMDLASNLAGAACQIFRNRDLSRDQKLEALTKLLDALDVESEATEGEGGQYEESLHRRRIPSDPAGQLAYLLLD